VSPEAVINQQMFTALDKIAFLPFGLVVDKWRWEAFSGAITPAQWNARWWELRKQYQGVAPRSPRAATDFDPGAKYHVPSNTPYLRYFLSTILQFQFHRALCKASGWTGPLHECSIYGNPAPGTKFAAMLALGREQAVARRARGRPAADRSARARRHRDPRLLRGRCTRG
jgi:peptidyl-dipeptidase A